jgi:hypothetical protein
VLASYADKLGRSAFPSVESLQEDTGLSRRSVYRAIKTLEDAGVIVRGDQSIVAAHIKRADKRPVCYDMVMDLRGATVTPGVDNSADLARGATQAPREADGVPHRHERGATQARTGCHSDTQSVIDHSLISKPSSQPSVAARGTRLPKDWVLKKALGEWALTAQPTWTAEHVRAVADGFRDHWIAQPGLKGRKVDWDATWRNWVRNAKPIAGAAGRSQDAPAGAWWESDAGITAKGAELEVPRQKDEPTPQYLVRVAKVAGRGPWIDHILKTAQRVSADWYQKVVAHLGEALMPTDFYAS